MKLEVGKWCRTEKGTIFKIIGGNVDMWEIDIDYSYLSKCENEDYNSYAYNKNNSLFEDLVVKASYNIVDILEVGDYVNGYLVTAILSSNNKVYEIQVKRPNNRTGVWIERIRNNGDIKSIVTKEQFENMKYIIGE